MPAAGCCRAQRRERLGPRRGVGLDEVGVGDSPSDTTVAAEGRGPSHGQAATRALQAHLTENLLVVNRDTAMLTDVGDGTQLLS